MSKNTIKKLGQNHHTKDKRECQRKAKRYAACRNQRRERASPSHGNDAIIFPPRGLGWPRTYSFNSESKKPDVCQAVYKKASNVDCWSHASPPYFRFCWASQHGWIFPLLFVLWWKFSMLVSTYNMHLHQLLGVAQVIGGFLQQAATLGQGSSSLPHIIFSPPLANLWQMTAFSSLVFFVIVDCHFVVMSPLCIRSLPDFCCLFAFVFSFGLCLLTFSFALYFWWMGSHPWFLFTGFFFCFMIVS